MMMFDRLRDRHPGESVASDCNALGTPFWLCLVSETTVLQLDLLNLIKVFNERRT